MINENVFDQIAKLLALPTIKRQLKKAEHLIDEDPDLASTMVSLEYHYNVLNDKLDGYCKRNPNSNLCKEKRKK